MRIRKFSIPILLFILSLLFSVLACGQATPEVQQAPAPIPLSQQQKYQPNQMYDEAVAISRNIVQSYRDNLASNIAWSEVWYSLGWSLIIAGIILAVITFLGQLTEKARIGGACAILVLIVGVDVFWLPASYYSGYQSVAKGTPDIVEQISYETGSWTLSEGIDRTQKREAENFQLIAAATPTFGYIDMNCTSPVNHKADCTAVSDYYWADTSYDCEPIYDDEGDKIGEDCDTKYYPDFTKLRRYYVVPNTKAKYLFSDIYDLWCVNDDGSLSPCAKDELGNIADSEKRSPAIFLHQDWRAPVEEMANNPTANFHIPELWQQLNQAKINAESGINTPAITTYWVGKYFHWGFASGSEWAVVYTGQYELLKSLVPNLPSPNGQWFNYQNINGQTVSLNTMLYSQDGDLATLIDPVFFIGFDQVDPNLSETFNAKMRELQGVYGPGYPPDRTMAKQSINYVVAFNHDVVVAMGGLDEAVKGFMGLLQDEARFGLFKMPKNQTITAYDVDVDQNTYTAQVFETALPFGNDLVKRDIRLAISEPTPFTWENAMGVTTSTYLAPATTKQYAYPEGGKSLIQYTMPYTYSDNRYAGGVLSFIYSNELPENVAKYPMPDPYSDECAETPIGQPGYVRPQMCLHSILQASIPISEDGRTYMHTIAAQKTHELIGNANDGGGRVILAFLFMLFSIAFSIWLNSQVQVRSVYGRRQSW